jgi:threonine dehydratase
MGWSLLLFGLQEVDFMRRYDTAPELTDTYLETVWETLPHYVRPTVLLPCPCPPLLANCMCEVTLATETFQYTGSFKFRAAYNLLASVPQRRVVAASSGNFGQAVAYACQLLGKQCTIVMPATSAQVKIAAVQRYGGTVDLIDVNQTGRAERVAQLLREQPDAFHAPAYDDYRVVAGNSTLGQDIFRRGQFDVIVVPVGGGGLSSGIVVARDHVQAKTEVIGAEPLLGNDAARSLRTGQLVRNEREPVTIADGARTLSLGQLNWEILQHGLSDIIEVPDEVIAQAVRHCFQYVNLKVEPTGALAIGAIFAYPERFVGKKVCCVVSGGNVDPAIYARLITMQ